MELRRATGRWRGPVCALLCLAGGAFASEPRCGFFTVAQQDGVWWFLDPAGRPFFSLGVNMLMPGAGRKEYNAAKPQYAAWRYYADEQAWARQTLARLKRWGFNTLGGWHDRRMRDGRWPYCEVLHFGAEVGVPWCDLFADSFAQRMDELAAQRLGPCREDPQVLGWFTDNELAWYPEALFTFHLGEPQHSETRQRLVALLRERYQNDFSALREDFIVTDDAVDNFDALDRGGALKLHAGGRGYEVVEQFTEALAERYYDVVCQAVRNHDPNHLILGDRYAGFCPDAVVRAAGRHVDVVSTNFDWPRGTDGYLPGFYFQRLAALSAKPLIVTEYYAAAADNQSGNPNTGELFVVVQDQAQRAAVAERRLRRFAEHPGIVGAHWFAFADEPPHGRPKDGEDYNFGLVDVHNQPYEAVTTALRRGHDEVLPRHAAADDPLLTVQLEIPPLPRETALEAIDAVLDSHIVVPSRDGGAAAELLAAWTPTCLYLTLTGNHYLQESAYAADVVPLSEGLWWRINVEANGNAEEMELQMLNGRSRATPAGGQFTYWHKGVRWGATAALPAAMFGLTEWPSGLKVALKSELADRRAGRETVWEREMRLGSAPKLPALEVEHLPTKMNDY